MTKLLLGIMLSVGCGGLTKAIIPLENAVVCTHILTSEKGTCSAAQVEHGAAKAAFTAAHCIPEAREYVWLDGVPSMVLAVDRVNDVALVQPVGPRFCVLRTENPIQGERVVVYGAPMSLEDVATFGFVARESVRMPSGQQAVLIDATGYFGSSGGGVWDSEGRLIGIVSVMPSGGVPALLFAVHTQQLVKTIQGLKR